MQEDAQAGNSGIIKVGSAPKVLAMDPSAALARRVSAEPASDPRRWPFRPTKVLCPWLVSCGHDRAGLHLCRLALVSFVTGCGRICHVSPLFASVFISFTYSLSFAGFSHQTHNHTLRYARGKSLQVWYSKTSVPSFSIACILSRSPKCLVYHFSLMSIISLW